MDCGIPERYTRPSFMDMLPDVITDEEMDAMKRHMQGVALGLIDCVCEGCGREFIAHREHRFRRIVKTRKGVRTAFWCSHKCFRPIEIAEAEEYRRRTLGAWVQKEKTRLQRAQERLEKCEKKLAEALAETEKPEWETMSSKRRGQINGRISHWRAECVLAETKLEEAQKHDD